MTVSSRRASRASLSRQDWIDAGQRVLREEGAAALKLATLTQLLGVTTGSFYHHFSEFGEYLDALADHYASESPREALRAVAQDPDPVERIRTLRRMAEEQDIPRLDAAMRVWAASSPRARKAVAKLDRLFLQFLEQAFRDLGFDRDEARVRALLAFSASAAIVLTPWGKGEADVERALHILTSS